MIISIVNQKGGTAKTTTTLNLGCALAKHKKKVLLVDMDAQASLTYSMGFMNIPHTISHVFHQEKTTKEVIIQTEEKVDLLPSDITLADVELAMTSSEDRESYLKEILLGLNSTYDYILIDSPPSMSLLTINALTASDYVLIPMQLDVLSLQGLELIIQTVNKVKQSFNDQLEIIGILPVLVDFRRKLTSEVLEYLNEQFSYKVFKSMIRSNVKASEAPSFGKSVISYAPLSNSAQDYASFAKEILKFK